MSRKRVGLALAVLAVLGTSVASCSGAKHSSAQGSPSLGGQYVGTSSSVFGIVLFEGGPYVPSPSPLPGGFVSGTKGRPYRFVIVQVKTTSGPNAGRVMDKATSPTHRRSSG